MLYFSRWKTAIVLLISLAGIVLALPNLLPASVTEKAPSWLQPVTLGLDLQGGSHLLLEVETNAVVKEQVEAMVESIRTVLRKEKIRYSDLTASGLNASVTILDSQDYDRARQALRQIGQDIVMTEQPGGRLVLSYTEQSLAARNDAAVKQSIEIVRRRVDELGTREPSITRQGVNRIVVQLPGENDPQRIKSLLGKTAKLTFHLLDYSTAPQEAAMGRVPPGSMILPALDASRAGAPASYVVRKKVELGGDELIDAQATFQDNNPVVSFRFSSQGARKFGEITRENVGRPFAIVLDEKVISAPVIREPILAGSGVISGNFTVQEANDLALLLRAGALPAPMVVLEERTVGPDLGADSIRSGTIASLIGLLLVAGFMVVGYGLFGVFANIALVINLAMLVGLLSLLGSTLTLPGIAGIVLTMGMAVDANVLIYERMREEFKSGRSLISALDAGFSRAFTTILDSNITTLVAALLLFVLGSGPVRGFAVTLTLGLITSMFTAIWLTRLMISVWVRRSRAKTLPI